tara:strand:- start:23 stop:601 length:579 start_codon:yes stop_codon:yes gene_type:complete
MPKQKSGKKKGSKVNLKKIDKKLNKILKYEKEQKKADNRQLKQDEDVEDDIEKIKKDLEGNPLKKITTKDVGKALIGSFIGLTSHYAFLEGAHFADNLTIVRATILLVIAYAIGLIFIYVAGFRKVKQIRLLSFIPARVTLIYVVSLIVIYFVFYIFGLTEHATTIDIYKQMAAVSIPAIIGASAADLIGKH